MNYNNKYKEKEYHTAVITVRRIVETKINTPDTYKGWFVVLSVTFNNISAIHLMATSCSGGRSRSTRREPPALGKQLVNFIICGCESSAPFLLFTKPGANRTVLVVCLYELLPSNYLTHWAPGPLLTHINITTITVFAEQQRLFIY
jgi:hypothetical protein